MFVPICSRFHAKRSNSGKMKTCEIPLFHALVKKKPLYPAARNFVADHSKDFVILACTVLIGLQSVTNTQTDGQTDGRLNDS